jgi:hypothetical protein
MSDARLASGVLVSALIRRAESLGGFAAVLARGDSAAGSILLILAKRGVRVGAWERVLQSGGDYKWQDMSGQTIDKEHEIDGMVRRRRNVDPDLWVVELDIPSPERFAAEMNDVN